MNQNDEIHNSTLNQIDSKAEVKQPSIYEKILKLHDLIDQNSKIQKKETVISNQSNQKNVITLNKERNILNDHLELFFSLNKIKNLKVISLIEEGRSAKVNNLNNQNKT